VKLGRGGLSGGSDENDELVESGTVDAGEEGSSGEER
jgi:hypothetical protein